MMGGALKAKGPQRHGRKIILLDHLDCFLPESKKKKEAINQSCPAIRSPSQLRNSGSPEIKISTTFSFWVLEIHKAIKQGVMNAWPHSRAINDAAIELPFSR